MTYKVIITESAFKDLEGIKSYIALDNEENAKRYVEKIFDKLDTLDAFLYRGLAIKNSILEYAKAHYIFCLNHVAIYQINEIDKCVYILRVLSHFQDWRNIVNKEIMSKYDVLIENETILITKMNTSMCYDVYRNSLDEDNRRFVPDEVFESLEEASEVVNVIIENYDNPDGPFIYAIIRKKDNANIGYVQLVKIEEGWEIGYHIAKIYTGNGYASMAVTLFLEYLKNNSDLKEIYGVALAANKASRRVLEKCGFTLYFEGAGVYQGKKRKIIKTIRKI